MRRIFLFIQISRAGSGIQLYISAHVAEFKHLPESLTILVSIRFDSADDE